ncbi:hypothetical protein SEA_LITTLEMUNCHKIN_14 [Gordonia phage LittleMunchkin]|nr:hypothetical protein SEA_LITTLEMUNCHKIN_14 [Gordonia phage LittleMunchkin]
MPEGIIAEIDGGFATLDFVDRSLRGPALQKLIDIGGQHSIDVLTRSGPRKQYRVPEGNAREAGLIDEATAALVGGDTGAADALANSGSTTGSPDPVTSRNAWGTGRDPVTVPVDAPVEDPADEDAETPEIETETVGDQPVSVVSETPADDHPVNVLAGPVPDEDWKYDDMRAYARDHGIDLDGARSKVDVLERIRAVAAVPADDADDIPVTSDDTQEGNAS